MSGLDEIFGEGFTEEFGDAMEANSSAPSSPSRGDDDVVKEDAPADGDANGDDDDDDDVQKLLATFGDDSDGDDGKDKEEEEEEEEGGDEVDEGVRIDTITETRVAAAAVAAAAERYEQAQEQVPVRLLASVPQTSAPEPEADGFLVRLPGSVAVEQSQFEPTDFVSLSSEARARAAQREAALEGSAAGVGGETRVEDALPAEFTMRWRAMQAEEGDEEGAQTVQSNARLVKWSNGEWTLVIGKRSLRAVSQPAGAGQRLLFSKKTAANDGAEVLESHGELSNRLTFVAAAGTKSTRRLQPMARTRLVERANSQVDPDLAKRQKEALEQARIRAREAQRAEEFANSGFYGSSSRRGGGGYEEEELDEAAAERAANRERRLAVDEAALLESKQSSSSWDGDSRKRRARKRVEDDDEDEDEDMDNSDDDEDEGEDLGDEDSDDDDEDEDEDDGGKGDGFIVADGEGEEEVPAASSTKAKRRRVAESSDEEDSD
jgi:RNA polymerase-associated protein LEO1